VLEVEAEAEAKVEAEVEAEAARDRFRLRLLSDDVAAGLGRFGCGLALPPPVTLDRDFDAGTEGLRVGLLFFLEYLRREKIAQVDAIGYGVVVVGWGGVMGVRQHLPSY